MSEWKRISTLANVRRGASPRPIGDPSYFGGNVGWVRISDVTKSSRFLRETEQYVSPLGESLSVRVNPGDLVMSICGTLGRPIVIDIPACIHDGFVQFTNLKDVDSVYLFYALQFSESKFNGMGQPGTQTNLNTGLVGRLEIFAPPIETQRQIATILTTMDEVIEATEKLVEKHQQIKAGLMHDLFTRGLWTRPELARGDQKGTPAEATAQEGQLRPTPEEAPVLYQDSPLGLIPKAWKVELLDALAKRGSGHTPNRYTPSFWDGGIKWVSLADSSKLDQLYISETDKEISLLGIENSSAVLHPAGIVVLSRDAGIGKSAITTCPMAVSQHFMCWLCGPELDNHYLYYWLQDQKRVFENISTGTTIPTIGLGFFRRYKIAVPTDMDEQQKIRVSLLSSDETIFALQNNLAKLRQQKQGLMHDLLTGRVRVDGERGFDSQS